MPGVNVLTAVRQGPSAQSTAEGVTYFVPGITERGRTDRAVLVRSMAEYQAAFGDRVAYGTLYDDLRTHFEEGGVQAYVARVVGAAATIGKLDLMDRAATPLKTVTINASSQGAWSTRLSVQVKAGTAANTVDVSLLLDGAVVELYAACTSPADVVARINANSLYATAVDAASITAAPNNLPAVSGPTVLSAGNDDRASVTSASMVTALSLFGVDLGTGVVAVPTFPSSQVGSPLLAHAQQFNRIALASVAPGSTPAQAKAAAAALIPAGAGGEFGGLVYPSIKVPLASTGSGTRTIGPEGYAAACRARAVTSVGQWKVPAGENAVARYVVDTDVPIDRATGDDLDAAKVSAIRVIQNTVRLYGWKALTSNQVDYPFLSSRDLINLVQVRANRALEPFVFATVDGGGQKLSQLQAALVGVVEPIARAGGLWADTDANGNQVDPGYTVDTGSSVNTMVTLANQELRGLIGLRPAPTASLITLTVVQASLNASL